MVWQWIAAGVGAFIGVSELLLRFPHWIHRRKVHAFHPRHVSHRGGLGEKHENTLLAFRNAVAQGTDMFELDVHLTADKQVVVFHDHDFQRVMGHPGHIKDIHYNDLPHLPATVTCQSFLDAAQPHTVTHDNPQDIRIPLLEQLFSEFPKMPMNIDCKEADCPELYDKVHALVVKYNRQSITAWGSFHDTTTRYLYAKDPSVPLWCSLRRCVIVYTQYMLGLLPFMPFKETHFEMVYFSPRFEKLVRSRMSRSWKTEVLVMLARFFSRRKRLYRHLQGRGVKVILWVVNTEDEFADVFDNLGADAVMTDYPSLLRKFLDRRRDEVLEEIS